MKNTKYTTPAQDIEREVRLYLQFNAGVTDARALALGLAEFLADQFGNDSTDRDDEKLEAQILNGGVQ